VAEPEECDVCGHPIVPSGRKWGHKHPLTAPRHSRPIEPVRPDLHTYGVSWYVEVDAASPEDAIKKARKYLAPSYRDNWEPTSVEKMEVDGG
jgi:hypothetical protein